MGVSQNEAKMEGWLYTVRSNRFGLQFSQKRYFILHNSVLKSYKAIPTSDKEEPVRSAIIDSCIRVTDNGRESIQKKVFFIFTLYSTSDNNNQLKLGALSSEEAASWIQSLKDASLKESPGHEKDFVAFPKKRWPSLRLGNRKSSHSRNHVDWPLYSSVHSEAMTSDVIAPSPWKIFGCQNGLRLFKEAKDGDSRGGHWDDHPAIMAVGVVPGTSESIFRAVMSLGPTRSEWDFCLYRGGVVEHLDGHTDIIHKQLYSDWLPWGMQRRDLLLQRYWRREDDGTYVILYHSVYHKKCPPHSGYIRARLKSGGYVITPVNQGQQSIVKHMLGIDWKFWNLYFPPSAARSLTIRMLERVAALRELFKANQGNYSSECISPELPRDIDLHQVEKEDVKVETQSQSIIKIEEENPVENEMEKPRPSHVSLMGLNEAHDEFFDVPDPEFFDHLESEWSTEPSQELRPLNMQQPKLGSAAGFVKKLHDLAIQKKGYMELHEVPRDDGTPYTYGTSLPKDPACSLPHTWSAGDPSAFLIRGKDYLKDHRKTKSINESSNLADKVTSIRSVTQTMVFKGGRKLPLLPPQIKAKGTLMQMVGADFLISDKREDDIGSRLGGIVQKYAAKGGPEFFFIVNFQVPGAPRYTIALYYIIKTPLEDHPLLYNFVNGDDAYRNSRFKLIPYISKGSWIVKQSVGKKACLLAQFLDTHYYRGKNYLEVEIDVGSSTVARGVANLCLGYLNNLVVEMAFVIQGNTQEELPECLLGTCRLNHLDVTKTPLALP